MPPYKADFGSGSRWLRSWVSYVPLVAILSPDWISKNERVGRIIRLRKYCRGGLVSESEATREVYDSVDSEEAESVDDARFMISHLASLTNNADTKAGLVATATTVLLGIAFSQRRDVARLVQRAEDLEWMPLGSFVLVLLGGAVAVGAVARALWPRLLVSGYSRYSWPAVAKASSEVLVETSFGGKRNEAWRTAHDMSRILAVKYKYLRVAISSWLVSAIFLLCWFVLVG